ncbi:MAG: hypothetical protein GY715_10180 [Planctomycetes bacterium]|nr:hypothetical protein [Planctomycetota bacterium]
MYLQMGDEPNTVRVHLTTPDAAAEPHEGARVVQVGSDQLVEAIDSIIHKLHFGQLLLIPVGKWRHLFDTVAFDLADNEDWQAVDTAATVELNTRDPLLCESADFQMVIALTRSLLTNADSPEQGLFMTTTAAPVLLEIVPEGAVRVSIGNAAMADEVAGALDGSALGS